MNKLIYNQKCEYNRIYKNYINIINKDKKAVDSKLKGENPVERYNKLLALTATNNNNNNNTATTNNSSSNTNNTTTNTSTTNNNTTNNTVSKHKMRLQSDLITNTESLPLSPLSSTLQQPSLLSVPAILPSLSVASNTEQPCTSTSDDIAVYNKEDAMNTTATMSVVGVLGMNDVCTNNVSSTIDLDHADSYEKELGEGQAGQLSGEEKEGHHPDYVASADEDWLLFHTTEVVVPPTVPADFDVIISDASASTTSAAPGPLSSSLLHPSHSSSYRSATDIVTPTTKGGVYDLDIKDGRLEANAVLEGVIATIDTYLASEDHIPHLSIEEEVCEMDMELVI